MSRLSVSILIPVFNRADLISETIESALSQTYSDYEIVVVDNNSTDGTWDIIKDYAQSYSRIRAFKNDTNIGPVKNWKRCIDEALGEYGKILWSDDLIEPDFLEKTTRCKANQREGQTMLSNLRTAMEAYYAENNFYTDSTSAMDFEFKGADLYNVSITADTTHTFTATATASLREGTSTWQLTEEGDISLNSDGCSS